MVPRPTTRVGATLSLAMFGVRTKEKVVAMSFDDGPDARYTQHVLDLLASHRSHATFFEIGANALGLPKLTLATLAAGHSIGNHTHDHPDLEQFNPSQVDVEIERGADAIAKAGAPRPEFFRPPKGLTDEVVGVLADAEKYRTVFWGSCVEALSCTRTSQRASRRCSTGSNPATSCSPTTAAT